MEFRVGPTKLYDSILSDIDVFIKNFGSGSHRGIWFKYLYEDLESNIKSLFSLDNEWEVLLLSSATSAWAITTSSLSEQKNNHIITGKLSESYAKQSESIGLNVNKVFIDTTTDKKIKNILCELSESKELYFLHTESTNGYTIDLDSIRELKTKSDILLVSDITGSFPLDVNPSFFFDAFFFSVQKYFSLPPGLAILCVNRKTIDTAREINLKTKRSSYLSLTNYLSFKEKRQPLFTINVMNCYLLNQVVQNILQDKTSLLTQHSINYEIIENFINKNTNFDFFIQSEENRSKNIITIVAHLEYDFFCKRLREIGVNATVSSLNKDNTLVRIGNFYSHKPEDYSMLCNALNKI
jgi:aspartate aminotransferase-like enzyme